MKTLQDKLKQLKDFKDSDVYKDYVKLVRQYYDGAFGNAMNQDLDKEKRVGQLDFMRGVAISLEIFNAVEEEYENQIRQGEQDV